jgi:beta-hydroxyacyl-ACP dehydratase FabZ
VEEIIQTIPQRFPMLMIDRILEESPGRCVALKNVTINECHFIGHFPGRPIMPGCLLLEAMAQSGNFLVPAEGTGATPAGPVSEAFLLSSQVKFHLPVVPGDQVIITSRFLGMAKDTIRFKSDAHVDGALVASASFLVLVRRDAVDAPA